MVYLDIAPAQCAPVRAVPKETLALTLRQYVAQARHPPGKKSLLLESQHVDQAKSLAYRDLPGFLSPASLPAQLP